MFTYNPNYNNSEDSFYLEEERLKQFYNAKILDQFIWEVE